PSASTIRTRSGTSAPARISGRPDAFPSPIPTHGRGALQRRIDWTWIATGTLVAFCIGAGGLLMVLMTFAIDILPDYSTFWTAARLSLTGHAGEILYDAQRMTELQSWLVRNEDLRPWAYPPSALFVLLPFAQLPFWLSLVV